MNVGLLDGDGNVVNVIVWSDDQPVPETWGGLAIYAQPCAIGGRVVDGVYTPPTPEEPPPAERRSIRKLLVTDRLIAANLAEAALAGFAANPIAKLRWDSAVDLWADDADVIAFLTMIGADPDAILAPE
jgi:hypothetical protein